MIVVSNKLYSFIAFLFVLLSLLGYQLVTSLFLPLSSDVSALSHSVTYPYRALVFGLAFFLVLFTPLKQQVHSHSRQLSLFYVIFFFVYFFRIFFDIFVRDVYVQPGFRTTTIQYIIFAMIPSLLAVLRCVRYVSYDKLGKWLTIVGVILLGVMVWNQNSLIALEVEEEVRGEANIALGSIGLGHTCLSLIIIFFSRITCQKDAKWYIKTILILSIILSFVLMLRAASRGPLVAFVVIMLFYIFSRIKNKLIGFIIAVTIIFLLLSNLSAILDWVGSISPVMERRMGSTIYENESSGREVRYDEAIDIFFQNPFLGKQFVLSNGMYPHNSILDVMIGLGFLGAIVWIYFILRVLKIAYRHTFNKTSLMTISLLSIQFILKGFFSGALYIQIELIICMMIVISLPTYLSKSHC